MTGAIVAAIIVVLVVSFGLARQRRDDVGAAVSPDAGPVLDTRSLGVDLGRRATLVQFSSRVCAPCRVTKRVLGELTALDAGPVHVDLDDDDHLARAVKHGVTRTPTVLLLDPAGAVVRRFVGPSRRPEFQQALAELASRPAPRSRTRPASGPRNR